ncbi:MAG: polysaccharide biosynthesis/export family protein [Paludibacteraceae bacterium]|nr:polysaccharide biosynthesis/export family protein [Paludibacteraceae bacterium]
MNRHLLIMTFIICLTACTTVKQMTLLPEPTTQDAIARPAFIIDEGDLLDITLSAPNNDAVAAFETAGTNFLVDADGYILFPEIGKVAVMGKTEKEVEAWLSDTLSRYIDKLILRVRIDNAHITVIGEVNHQQSVKVAKAIPLLQALGTVGGLTRNARRDNILIQRKENGKIVHYRVNLLDNSLFSSPCYYLQKGDILYVSPLHSLKIH